MRSTPSKQLPRPVPIRWVAVLAQAILVLSSRSRRGPGRRHQDRSLTFWVSLGQSTPSQSARAED
jgi:hypothetical protein